MSDLTKAHTFNVGYDIFAVITSGTPDRRQTIADIRARLNYLDIPVEFADEAILLAEQDGGAAVQDLLRGILARLNARYGDDIVNHFLLAVNVFVSFAHLPIRDLTSIEASLRYVDLPPELIEKFRDTQHKYTTGFYDTRNPRPLLDWINRVHEHFIGIEAKEKQPMRKRKILFLFSCPKDADRIRIDEEERVIRECFERASLREAITWSSRHAVRVDDLRRAILLEKPDIVHFSGHGTGGTIVLEDEHGNSYLVPIDALGRYLSNKGLECVILNACTTQTLGHAIGGVATISTPKPISDRAAIEFTRGFYDRVGAGGTLQEAFEEGCLNVELKGLGESFSAEYLNP